MGIEALGIVLFFVMGLTSAVALYLAYRATKERERLRSDLVRYSAISSVEAEVQRLTEHYQGLNQRLTSEYQTAQQQLGGQHAAARQQLEAQFHAAQQHTQSQLREASDNLARVHQEGAAAAARLLELRRELAEVEERTELHEVGFYQVRFGLESSAAYKARLGNLDARRKQMLSLADAARGALNWTVDGNRQKGQAMVKRQIKLMLRAFNGECDAAISQVTYKNVGTMQKRIEKSAEAVNKLGASMQCFIVPEYVNLRLEELFLVHEYREKLEAEREEQRQIRARMVEEQREEREREKALREAQAAEEKYEAALARAREELEGANARQKAKLEEQIALLQQQLADTQRKKAQAELTRSGHVYVLSNIGSFGDQVYKIGMTRRLDPMDRVWELSDASVPFDFDVHAMIYTMDAPTLENQLHRFFDERRLNKVNLKREFFRSTLEEIEIAVRQVSPGATIEFSLVAEAEEYRKTMAIERERHERRGVTPQEAVHG
jgi:hypothetical protein